MCPPLPHPLREERRSKRLHKIWPHSAAPRPNSCQSRLKFPGFGGAPMLIGFGPGFANACPESAYSWQRSALGGQFRTAWVEIDRSTTPGRFYDCYSGTRITRSSVAVLWRRASSFGPEGVESVGSGTCGEQKRWTAIVGRWVAANFGRAPVELAPCSARGIGPSIGLYRHIPRLSIQF